MNPIDTMQFRDYIFKHNPQRISLAGGDQIVVHNCPGNTGVTQNLGPQPRVVVCSGSFFDESFSAAMAQLTQFKQKTREHTAGMLFLPGLEPFYAQLAELSFDAVGDGRIIPYTMRFVEAQP